MSGQMLERGELVVDVNGDSFDCRQPQGGTVGSTKFPVYSFEVEC